MSNDDKFAKAIEYLGSLTTNASSKINWSMYKKAEDEQDKENAPAAVAPAKPKLTEEPASAGGEQVPTKPQKPKLTEEFSSPGKPKLTEEPSEEHQSKSKKNKNKKPTKDKNAPAALESEPVTKETTDTSKLTPEVREGVPVAEQLSEEQKARILNMARQILGNIGSGGSRQGPTFMTASKALSENVIREHGGGTPNKVLSLEDQEELAEERERAAARMKFKNSPKDSRKLFDDNFSTIYQLVREETGSKGFPALKDLADQAMQYVKDSPATQKLRQIQSLLASNFASTTQYDQPENFMQVMKELDLGTYDEYDDDRLVVVPRNQDGKILGYEKTLMNHIYSIYNILDVADSRVKSEIPKMKKHYELIFALFIQRVVTKIVWIYYRAYKDYSVDIALAKKSGESTDEIRVVPALVATPEDVLSLITSSREYATTIINYFRNAKHTDATKKLIQDKMDEEIKAGVNKNELYSVWLELDPSEKVETIMSVINSKQPILPKGSPEWNALYYVYFDALKKYNNLFIRTKIANPNIVNMRDFKFYVPNMDSACMTDADKKSVETELAREEASTGYTKEDIKRIQLELDAARNDGVTFGEPASDEPVNTNTVSVQLDPGALDVMVVTVHIIDQAAYDRVQKNEQFKAALSAEHPDVIEEMDETDFRWFGIFKFDKASGNISMIRRVADLENITDTALLLTTYEDLWPATERWQETAKEFILQGEEVHRYSDTAVDDKQASFIAAMNLIKKS